MLDRFINRNTEQTGSRIGLDGRLHPVTNGGYDSSGINPNNMYTGGPLPATRVPGVHTGGPYPPTPVPPIHTGGPLPPQVVNIPTLPPNDPAHRVPGMSTGGPLPPTPVPPVRTGGPLPPSQVPPIHTGGPLPPTQVPTPVHTGGPLPPSQVPPVQTGGNLPPQQVPSSFAAGDVVQQIISQMMNGQYGQAAARQGLALANQRGLLNSGMAAGNARSAALQQISPFVNQAMGLIGQRENNAFQGDQAQRERDLKTKLQSDSAFQQDWLSSNSFNRDFYGAMAMVPVQSAAQFQQMIAQYALDNPEVYTPQTIAGMTQFFNSNFQQILSQYMPPGGP